MRILLFIFCFFFSVSILFAQERLDFDDNLSEFSDEEIELIVNPGWRKEIPGFFWISAGFETAMYGSYGLCYGPGLTLAYNRGISMGLQSAYFLNFADEVDVLELGVLLRFNLRGLSAFSGPFIQVTGGQAIFLKRQAISFPSLWGMFYGSLNFGWRFLLGNTFFIEPSVRTGYPFLYGGGLSAGIKF